MLVIKVDKQTLISRLDEWILEQKLQEYSENTLKQYKANVLKFINWLPDNEEITKITTIKYKEYLGTIAGSSNSINTWIVTINKYLKWLDGSDLVIKKIKMQQKQSVEDVLSIVEYKRLLRNAKKLNMTEIYYIMKILAMTGIRVSVLKYFTVDGIKSNYIKFKIKGKENRVIVRQDLARELRHYCKEKKIKDGYLFPSPKVEGKMINNSTIWRQMKKVAGVSKVNKKKVHAHSFRHLFAQVFLATYSDNITELADILGHNSLETTRLYTRTSDAQKKAKLESLKF